MESESKQIGRPSKLTPVALELAKRYVGGDYAIAPCNDVVPQIEGLSFYLGVSVRTIERWVEYANSLNIDVEDDAEDNLFVQFCRTVEALKINQKRLLLNGGLAGVFNPTITKFTLGANHNMAETVHQKHENPDGTPLGFTLVVENDQPVS